VVRSAASAGRLAKDETVRFTPFDLLMVAALGGLVSLLRTALLARVARRWGVVDRPDGYKAHPDGYHAVKVLDAA
jgi:hypothetical protein